MTISGLTCDVTTYNLNNNDGNIQPLLAENNTRSIYVAGNNGVVGKYDPSGTLIDTKTVSGYGSLAPS